VAQHLSLATTLLLSLQLPAAVPGVPAVRPSLPLPCRNSAPRPLLLLLQIGGLVLHDGKVAEMKTGEGKTLVATLPVFVNALTGRGVHVLTVNSYLARRDAAW
jgi:hypothetical protein